MSQTITYIGSSDTRIVSAADLVTLGISDEPTDLVFYRGNMYTQTVPDDVALVLLMQFGFINASGQTAAQYFAALSALTISSQAGAAYTFVLADAGTDVEGNSAAAQTFTIPPNSAVPFPIGTQINVRQAGAGKITIAAGNGATTYDNFIRGRYIDIYWLEFLAALGTNTFTYSVDGAAAVTVDCHVAAINGLGVTTIDTGVVGNHTLVVTTGLGLPVIWGWRGRNATGIMPIRMLQGGASNAQLQAVAPPGLTGFGTAANMPVWGGGWVSLLGGFTQNWIPDLVVLGDRFLNDMITNASTPAQVAMMFDNIVQLCRAYNPMCDFIVALPHRGSFADAGQLYPQYRDVLRPACEEYGAILVDMWAIGRESDALWGNSAGNLGFWGSGVTGNGASGAAGGAGDPHLSDAGHLFMRSKISPLALAA